MDPRGLLNIVSDDYNLNLVKLSTYRIRLKWQPSHPCGKEDRKIYESAQEPDLNMKHWDFSLPVGKERHFLQASGQVRPLRHDE